MPRVALIALGSNLGDRRGHLDAAVDALRDIRGFDRLAVSSYHETKPIGGPLGQDGFLNAAARLETDLDPELVLAELQAIEARSGRVRLEHWGPRVLDLDLLCLGTEIRSGPTLVLPHPRMAIRRFVLAPLVEVAANFEHPTIGLTIAELLANLDRRPSVLELDGPDPLAAALIGRLCTSLPARLNASINDDQELWRVQAGGGVTAFHPATLAIALPGGELFASDPRFRRVQFQAASHDLDALEAEVLAACRSTRPG